MNLWAKQQVQILQFEMWPKGLHENGNGTTALQLLTFVQNEIKMTNCFDVTVNVPWSRLYHPVDLHGYAQFAHAQRNKMYFIDVVCLKHITDGTI